MNKKLISLLIALSMVAAHAVAFAQAGTATTTAEVAVEETVAVEEAVTEETATEEEEAAESSITREVTSSENFDDGITKWELLSGKGFKAQGSALYFKNKQTSETNNILMSKALSIKNADLEFDMKMASGSVYAGVMFRAEADKTMYQVRFYKNEGKAVLLKRVNSGELVEIKRANAKIKSDEYSKVGIRLVDNKISVRVDGKAIFTDIKDTSLKDGKIGFDMYCAEATIDNVEIVKYSNVEYEKVEIDPEEANKIKTYYVAPTGSSGDGTKENPFVGVAEAKKAAMKAKRTGNTANVVFLEGTYELDGPLKFTELDSGTEDSPVTYKADEGAKVVFTGASEIDHSKATPVEGKMENRIHESAKGKIVQIKLSTDTFPQDLIDYTERAWNGTAMNASRLKPPMIFLNDQQQSVAKWPNDDYASIAECTPGAAANVGGNMNNGGAIHFTNTEPHNWTQAERLFVEGWLGNYWTAEWAPIKNVNLEENKIEFKYRTAYGILAKHRWSAINLIEELDVPGEYYIDREEKMLYLYPPHELTVKDKITVAKIQNLVEFSGAEYITMEGIELTMAGADPNTANTSSKTGNGIVIDSLSKFITIKDCTITNSANSGVHLNGFDNVIDGCRIYNSGIDGISIEKAGDRANLIPSNVVVQNSIISDVVSNTGRNAYAGIRITQNTVDVHIRNNIIHNMANNAIRYRGNGHQFYHNEFSSVCTSAADAGALYTGRSWSDWGCSAYENYFHDIGMISSESTYGSHAMYWDDNQTGQDFSRNIVFANNRELCKANHLSGGSNTFKYNTTVASNTAIVYGPRTIQNAEGWMKSTNANTLTEIDPNSAPFLEKYPEMSKQIAKVTAADGMVFDSELIGNLYVDTLGNSTNPRVKEDYIYENNIDLPDIKEDDYDEIFVDPKNHDFRVTDEARKKYNLPDELLGEEFDLNQIGLQNKYVVPEEWKKTKLLLPANESIGLQPTRTTLVWTKPVAADVYEWEIAKDPHFTTIVDSGATLNEAACPENLEPNTTYYWRVKVINKSRQIGFETKSEVWSFTTGKDVLVTGMLENKIAQAKSVMNSIKEGTTTGIYKRGTKQKLAEEIEEAEAILKDIENATQETLDLTAKKINVVILGLDEYINVGYATINLDPSVNITDRSAMATIERGDNFAKMTTEGAGSFFVFEEVIPNHNVMTFKTKVDTLEGGWAAYGLRVRDPQTAIYAQPSYYFLIKPDVFELQKQGAIYQTAPNDGRFKFNEWNDIEFASVTTSRGIHMFFKLNGEVIFDFIDSTEPNYEPGMFGIFNATKNSTVEIAPADNVPTTLFERSEAIQRQLDSNATLLYTESDQATKTGTFVEMTQTGFNNTKAQTTTEKGATFSWKMVGEKADNGKNYRVGYYHIPSANGDPNVKVTLDGYGGTYETTIDLTKGEKGWVDLGTFRFQDADYIGRLNITFESSGQGEMTMNAVEFEPLEGGENMLGGGIGN